MRGDALPPQRALDGRDQNAAAHVGQETVVNPVPGEADDQVDVLHGPSVTREPYLVPIG